MAPGKYFGFDLQRCEKYLILFYEDHQTPFFFVFLPRFYLIDHE